MSSKLPKAINSLQTNFLDLLAVVVFLCTEGIIGSHFQFYQIIIITMLLIILYNCIALFKRGAQSDPHAVYLLCVFILDMT